MAGLVWIIDVSVVALSKIGKTLVCLPLIIHKALAIHCRVFKLDVLRELICRSGPLLGHVWLTAYLDIVASHFLHWTLPGHAFRHLLERLVPAKGWVALHDHSLVLCPRQHLSVPH